MGRITNYIDVAQVTLYVFWFFFAGLVFYLLRENKREGYPLDADRSDGTVLQGFPAIPAPKTFLLPHGGTQMAPRAEKDDRRLAAEPAARFPGAPLVPTGNAMLDGIGPGAWAERSDEPDLTADGADRIVPLRTASVFHLDARDPDPRGMVVVGADNVVGGKVTDVWVDRSESLLRYLEVEVTKSSGADQTTRTVLLPINFSRIDGRRRQVRVQSILGGQFADVPGLRTPTRVTRREEERVCAYYGAGTLYATPARAEPLL